MSNVQSFVYANSQLEVIDCEDEESIACVEPFKNQSKLKPFEVAEEKCHRHNKTLPTQPTEAFKIFEKSLKFLALFGVLIGTDMSYEWRWNRRFVMTYIVLASFWSMAIYTQLLHVYNNESKRTLEQFAMYGIACSVNEFLGEKVLFRSKWKIIFKITCFEKNHKRITALYDATYKISQEVSESRAEMLTKRLNANHSFYIFLCILIFSIGSMYMFSPLKSYFIDHQYVAFLPMEIMFIDQSTATGFLLANVIFLIFGAFGISGYAYVAFSFDISIMNYAPRVDILEIDFDELDELWSHTSTCTNAYRSRALNNICQKYIDLKKYVAEIKQIYEHQLCLCFVSSYLSQIICLYQFRVNHWVNGITFVIGMFLEMIFYCLMGTKITIENERLCYLITQSKWYTYDLRSQNLILQLLGLSMNMEELWIGPFKPLSVLTATEITKSIYTYYTIMSEVL